MVIKWIDDSSAFAILHDASLETAAMGRAKAADVHARSLAAWRDAQSTCVGTATDDVSAAASGGAIEPEAPAARAAGEIQPEVASGRSRKRGALAADPPAAPEQAPERRTRSRAAR